MPLSKNRVHHWQQKIFLLISCQPIGNMSPLMIPMGASHGDGPDWAEQSGGSWVGCQVRSSGRKKARQMVSLDVTVG